MDAKHFSAYGVGYVSIRNIGDDNTLNALYAY
jgi:hypothetical protein